MTCTSASHGKARPILSVIAVTFAVFSACQPTQLPADPSFVNSSPKATLSVDRTFGDAATIFTFDASGSYDAEDPVGALRARWDWESNGIWDTNFDVDKIVSHAFGTNGAQSVTCQIQDTGGLNASATVVVEIALRFVVMGDSRGSDQGANSQVLGQIVSDVLQLSPIPVCLVFCGDLVTSGGPAQLSHWRSIVQPLADAGVAIYPVIGNHELGVATSPPVQKQEDFRATFDLPSNGPVGYEELCFSVALGPVLLVALDSYFVDGAGTHANLITDEQQAWLSSTLASAAGRHTFVFAHGPAFPVGPHIGSSLDRYTAQRNSFWTILADANVTAYLCGHEHLYARRLIDDEGGEGWAHAISQVLVGTCGAPIASNAVQKKQCESYAESFNFCVVDVVDTSARFTVYDQSMNVLDRFTETR